MLQTPALVAESQQILKIYKDCSELRYTFVGPKLVILGTQLPKCIRLERDYKPVLLCISTSLWVIAEPKSWSNYFFSAVFNL